MALSTANLYAAVQPNGSLFGLEVTNPVNQAVAYAGDPSTFGSSDDPLVGKPIEVSSCSAVASLSMMARTLSAASALAAIPPALTTMSPSA